MRELLFRGKSTSVNKWIIGDGIRFVEDVQGRRTALIYSDIKSSKQWFEVKADTIGQFIGERDRNRKPIFEGDMVNWTGIDYVDGETIHQVSIICWDSKELAYKHRIPSWADTTEQFGGMGNDVEVIGNTYDNPELLNEVMP